MQGERGVRALRGWAVCLYDVGEVETRLLGGEAATQEEPGVTCGV